MEVTIYRRHSSRSGHKPDRYSKRCRCRLWLQYSTDAGDIIRVSAKTRSWGRAKPKARLAAFATSFRYGYNPRRMCWVENFRNYA